MRSVASERLREQVRTAQAEYDRASKLWREVIASAPSGVPGPEGTMIADEATDSAVGALTRYLTALRAHHNFEVRGILPDDFELP